MHRNAGWPVSWRFTEPTAPMPDVPASPPRLYDLLLARTARLPVTLLLIGANTLIFLLMLYAGAGLWHSNNGVQLAWGANFGPATQDGQWWRLGSALFLHFGLIHIAMNLWALWDGGRLVERIYGHLRFALIYLVSGLSGNLLSLVIQGNDAVSGGASGAIFGIYGALLIYVWRERKLLDPHDFRWLFWAGSAFTCVSIGLGLLVPGIDNSAHIGGLLAGALIGTLLGRPVLGDKRWPWAPRWAAGLAWAAVVIGLVTHIPPPSYRWSDEIAARTEIREFLERETRIQASWQDIIRQDKLNAGSIQELAERIEFEITDPYDESFEQLSQLTLDEAAPSAEQIETLRAYSEKRRDMSQALVEQLRARSQFGPTLPNRPGSPLTPPAQSR
jgi:rhomboid protease GluP